MIEFFFRFSLKIDFHDTIFSYIYCIFLVKHQDFDKTYYIFILKFIAIESIDKNLMLSIFVFKDIFSFLEFAIKQKQCHAC